eukprot:7797897-Lingulodinium_polyedra.AAC.1
MEGGSIPRAIVQVEDDGHQQDQGPEPRVHQPLFDIVPTAVRGVVEEEDPGMALVGQVPERLEPSTPLVGGDHKHPWHSCQEGSVLG